MPPHSWKQNNSPDMSLLKDCIHKIKKFVKFNQTLILESTVYPGATLELFNLLNSDKKFILEKIFLGFSPERENPGDKSFLITPHQK